MERPTALVIARGRRRCGRWRPTCSPPELGRARGRRRRRVDATATGRTRRSPRALDGVGARARRAGPADRRRVRADAPRGRGLELASTRGSSAGLRERKAPRRARAPARRRPPRRRRRRPGSPARRLDGRTERELALRARRRASCSRGARPVRRLRRRRGRARRRSPTTSRATTPIDPPRPCCATSAASSAATTPTSRACYLPDGRRRGARRRYAIVRAAHDAVIAGLEPGAAGARRPTGSPAT